MQRRESGSNGMKASTLAVSRAEQTTKVLANEQLEAALSTGMSLIDTPEKDLVSSRKTKHGISERSNGSCLRKSRRRQDMVLTTKTLSAARPSRAKLPDPAEPSEAEPSAERVRRWRALWRILSGAVTPG